MAYTYFKITQDGIKSLKNHFYSSLSKFESEMNQIEHNFNLILNDAYDRWKIISNSCDDVEDLNICNNIFIELKESREYFNSWIGDLKETYLEFKSNTDTLLKHLENEFVRLSTATAISIDCDHPYFSNIGRMGFSYKMPNRNYLLLENVYIKKSFEDSYAFPESNSDGSDFNYEYKDIKLDFYYELNQYLDPILKFDYYDENKKKILK